ncbi:MAG: methyl-accepting chemotaxis protein [Candidatus Protistobacter heckmanni]|nr:methyl-accepting chemotaxis protein [Candidatus Protistobacter heckmanni]
MWLGFGAVLVILALIVGVSLQRFLEIAQANSVASERAEKIDSLRQLQTHIQRMRALAAMAFTAAPAEQSKFGEEFAKSAQAAAGYLAFLDKTLRAAEDRPRIAKIQELEAKSKASVAKLRGLLDKNAREDALRTLNTETEPLLLAYDAAVLELVTPQKTKFVAASEALKQDIALSSWIDGVLGIAGVVLGILIAWAFVRSTTRFIRKVQESTVVIRSATREIATGNADLSNRTEHQASNLEETASAMEQLTSTVRQNADNARQANDLAKTSSGVAEQGGDVVGEVVGTMGSISESSKKIADIISVIDGIAFQTNILALNAAVEAARAGEQGRGFAVVATEVRSLAQRSAAAAKDIKELINASVERVDEGGKLVDRAGRTMQEVVDSIRKVTGIMSEISAASQEQSQGIDEINHAVIKMDETTQQNAALVEEAAAAAESLNEQADILAEAVEAFWSGRKAQAAAEALPAPPRRHLVRVA